MIAHVDNNWITEAFEKYAFRNLYSRARSSLPGRRYSDDTTENAWRGFTAGIEAERAHVAVEA